MYENGNRKQGNLWPHVASVIGEIKPHFVFLENVAHHLRLGFSEVAAGLVGMGYRLAAGLFTAVEVGAPHKRERLLILAIREGDDLADPARLLWHVIDIDKNVFDHLTFTAKGTKIGWETELLMKFKRALRYMMGYFRYQLQMIRMSPPRMLSLAVSLLGILTAINELFKQVGTAYGAALCLAVFALYLLLIVRYPHRSAENSFPRDLRYKVIVPASENQQKRITEACLYFGDSAIDPIDGANSIAADEYSTVALRDYKGREVGFADYYAFNRDDALAYIDGRIAKRDFFADYYLPHPQARDAGAIYVSTVFRYDHISDRSAFGAKETALLALCLIKLIERVQKQPDMGWLIFASGGSAAGERLIRHFDLEESGRKDPDGNMIYKRDGVTQDQLAGGLKKFDYLGSLVKFDIVGLSG